jgi:hypothetical protein
VQFGNGVDTNFSFLDIFAPNKLKNKLLKLVKLRGTACVHRLIRELRTTVGNDFLDLYDKKAFH